MQAAKEGFASGQGAFNLPSRSFVQSHKELEREPWKSFVKSVVKSFLMSLIRSLTRLVVKPTVEFCFKLEVLLQHCPD